MKVVHTAIIPKGFSLTCTCIISIILNTYKLIFQTALRNLQMSVYVYTFLNTSMTQHKVWWLWLWMLLWLDLPYAVGGGCEHQEEDENQQDACDSWDWRQSSNQRRDKLTSRDIPSRWNVYCTLYCHLVKFRNTETKHLTSTGILTKNRNTRKMFKEREREE